MCHRVAHLGSQAMSSASARLFARRFSDLTITTSRQLLVSPGASLSSIAPPAAELAAQALLAGGPLHVATPQRVGALRVRTSSSLAIDGKLECASAELASGGALSLGTLRGGALALEGGAGGVDVRRLLEGTSVRVEARGGGVRVARLLTEDAELCAPAGPLVVGAAFSKRLALRSGGGGVLLRGLHGAAEVAGGGGRVEARGVTGALRVRGAGGASLQFDAPRGRSSVEAAAGVELVLVAPLPPRGVRVDVARATRVEWELGDSVAYEGGCVVERGGVAAAAAAAPTRGGSGKVSQAGAVRGFYDAGEGAEEEISIVVACGGLLRVTVLSYLQLIQKRVALGKSEHPEV